MKEGVRKEYNFKHLMHINRNTCNYTCLHKLTQNKVKSTKLFHNILITWKRGRKSNNTCTYLCMHT